MAGQHRIEALREYVKETRALDLELWWTCELYDKGALVSLASPTKNSKDTTIEEQYTIAWIDCDSALTIDEVNPKSKNKPLVREYLSMALDKLVAARGLETRIEQVIGAHITMNSSVIESPSPAESEGPIPDSQDASIVSQVSQSQAARGDTAPSRASKGSTASQGARRPLPDKESRSSGRARGRAYSPSLIEASRPSTVYNDLFETDKEAPQQEDPSRANRSGHRWAVDHSSGHYKFRTSRFIKKALSDDLKLFFLDFLSISLELLSEGIEACWRPGTFHVYDYGANIEILVSTTLESLPHKRHVPQDIDSEQEEDDGPTTSNGRDDSSEEEEEDKGPHNNRQDGRSQASSSAPYGPYQHMIRDSEGIQKLVNELEAQFDLESITTISYTLTVCLNYTTTANETHYLLADQNILAEEYSSSRDFTFYPQAFHPTYSNFSLSQLLSFLNSLTIAMYSNISDRNKGANVLSFSYFQGYSNIKRSVRHSPHNLLTTKGYTTVVIAVPTSYVVATVLSSRYWETFLQTIRGQATPNNPQASKPFARERQQIQVTIDGKEVAYRLKQVISLDVHYILSIKTDSERGLDLALSKAITILD
ncbi:hypothetical protein CMUS01_12731 [Colletotrichum musicola]|uniref:Uncharacterized protein n=1 Tax=Colletotrichum musicola TaxID=2175873 RepID=A0A8H6JIQ4_9PEZI|nr:hypothetical protein CMUS01_12731 [Colletotrichum musicola]